jgi:hypothetical protein
MTGGTADGQSWLLLVYRLPTDSSRARVAVWRDLKRLGALYLQQAVCVLPDAPGVRDRVQRMRARLRELGGDSTFLTLRDVEPETRDEFVSGFRSQSEKEYAEIVEECETKFFKEIEFERFRENYTFEESEEIRQDLDKLKTWMAKVQSRDWMAADGRQEAAAMIDRCEELLEDFETEVYQRLNPGDRMQ